MPASLVYLIHFARPYYHAKHYIGYTTREHYEERLAEHLSGRGARLLAAVNRAGISWSVVKVWRFDTTKEGRQHEKYLKHKSGVYHCPICQGGQHATITLENT